MKIVVALFVVMFTLACAQQMPVRITHWSATKEGKKGAMDICELMVNIKPSSDECSIKLKTPWGYKDLHFDCNSPKGQRVMPLIEELMLRECGAVRLPKRAAK